MKTNFHVSHMTRNDYDLYTMLNQFTLTRYCDFQVALAEDQHDCTTVSNETSTVTGESVFKKCSKPEREKSNWKRLYF